MRAESTRVGWTRDVLVTLQPSCRDHPRAGILFKKLGGRTLLATTFPM
jgi:hypothetical protein